METKEFSKYPKRQLIKLATDKNLISWEKGYLMTREELLSLLKNS